MSEHIIARAKAINAEKEPIKAVVLVGACIIDNILHVPHYPAEDSKLRAIGLARRRGGNTCNTAEVLQQLNISSTPDHQLAIFLINVLPSRSSSATKFIRDSLDPNINLEQCIYREAHTEPISSYIMSNAASDTRTIVTHNELPDMTVQEFVRAAQRCVKRVRGRTHFHFEGRSVGIVAECMRLLIERLGKDVQVSVEIEKPGRQGLQELTDLADIVFISKAWAEERSYSSPGRCAEVQCNRLWSQGPYVVCTWGKEGAWAARRWEGKTRVVGVGAKEVKVVDPVGAGDAFIAGFLWAMYGHEKGADLGMKGMLAVANECAGRKIAKEGFSGIMSEGEDWGAIVDGYEERTM